MDKLNRFFTKYAIILFLVLFVPTCLIMPQSEFLLSFILAAIGLIGISGTFDKNKLNRVAGVLSLIVSLAFFYHISHTEYEAELIQSKVNVIDIEFEYFVYINELEKTYTINKGDISFDEDNPLLSYRIYKVDIFGKKYLEKTGFRSTKMNDYYITYKK